MKRRKERKGRKILGTDIIYSDVEIASILTKSTEHHSAVSASFWAAYCELHMARSCCGDNTNDKKSYCRLRSVRLES
jgi:hypothetical protein